MGKKIKPKTIIYFKNEDETKAVPILHDAMIATRDAIEGKSLPLLIIDTSNRPDVENMIKLHRELKTGDVNSTWDLKLKSNAIGLYLSFVQPVSCTVYLKFDIDKYGGLLDQAIHVQGLYLMWGHPGDKFLPNIDRERIVVEIPSKHILKEWDNVWKKSLIKLARKEHKLIRADAVAQTNNFIIEWRSVYKNIKM